MKSATSASLLWKLSTRAIYDLKSCIREVFLDIIVNQPAVLIEEIEWLQCPSRPYEFTLSFSPFTISINTQSDFHLEIILLISNLWLYWRILRLFKPKLFKGCIIIGIIKIRGLRWLGLRWTLSWSWAMLMDNGQWVMEGGMICNNK